MPKLMAADDADGIVSVIASAVEFATTHPVLSKVLQDEPELVGGFVIAELPTLIARLLVLAEPVVRRPADLDERARFDIPVGSEEQTSELQSLMRLSYAHYYLKKQQHKTTT